MSTWTDEKHERARVLAARNNDRETVWTLAHRPWREVP